MTKSTSYPRGVAVSAFFAWLWSGLRYYGTCIFNLVFPPEEEE